MDDQGLSVNSYLYIKVAGWMHIILALAIIGIIIYDQTILFVGVIIIPLIFIYLWIGINLVRLTFRAKFVPVLISGVFILFLFTQLPHSFDPVTIGLLVVNCYIFYTLVFSQTGKNYFSNKLSNKF